MGVEAQNDGGEKRPLRAAGISAAARAATFPVTAVCTLVTASLTIRYAGAPAYAAIATLVTLSQLIPFADLGVGAGVVNAVSSGEPEEARRAVAVAIRVLLCSTLALIMVALIVDSTIGWADVLGISDAPIAHADVAALAVICVIALSLPFGVGQRVLIGSMRNPTAIAVSVLAPLTTLAGTAAIVWLRVSPTFLVFPAVVGSLFVAIISSVIAAKLTRASFLDVFRFKLIRYPGLLRIGVWYVLLTAASAASFQSGRIVLAHASGLREVAEFSLVMQFYLPLWSFFVAGGTALWPVFGRMRTSNADPNVLVLRMSAFFAIAATVCGLGLVILGPLVSDVLSKGDVAPPWITFTAAASLILVQSVQLVQGVSLTDRSGIRFQALCAMPMMIFVPVMTWLAAHFLGSAAPFVAAALGVLLFQILPNALHLRGARKVSEFGLRTEVAQ